MRAAPSSDVAFRVCDRRWPFLWADETQPEARWHRQGEGPCHYLSSTPDAAWAEYLRHADVREVDELRDIERSIWVVKVDLPSTEPELPSYVLIGNKDTYQACQAEARRLRAGGASGLRAPAASLLPPGAATSSVDSAGQHLVDWMPGVTYAVFGEPTDLRGQHVAEGRPDPSLLARVRYL